MKETIATIPPNKNGPNKRRNAYGVSGIVMTSVVIFAIIFFMMNPLFYGFIAFLWGLSSGDIDSWVFTWAFGISLLSLLFMFFIGSVGILRFIKVDRKAMIPVLIFLVLLTSRPLLHSFLTTVVLHVQSPTNMPILTYFDNPLMTSDISGTSYIIFLSVSTLFLLIFLNLLWKSLREVKE